MPRFQLKDKHGQPLRIMEAANIGAVNKTLLRTWPGFDGTIHAVGASITESLTFEQRLDEALVDASLLRPPTELREQARGESHTDGKVAGSEAERQFEESFIALGFDPDVAKAAARGRG